MAGEAKTSAFVLSSATVMIGKPEDVFEFQPDTHSVGLAKNFVMSSDMTYTELTQGAKNTVVHSTATSVQVRCNMEIYEYTTKNLAYGLGLDGSALAPISTSHLLKTAVVGGAGATTAVLNGDVSSSYAENDWVMIQGPSGATADHVHIAQLSAAPTFSTDTTLTFANFAIPTGTTFPVNSKIAKVHMVNVGSKDEQPFLAAKIVGILPEQNRPITLILPKLRITKGFSMGFRTDGYGNMPFEFTPYDLVATDPNYAQFGGLGQAFIFANT